MMGLSVMLLEMSLPATVQCLQFWNITLNWLARNTQLRTVTFCTFSACRPL